MLKRSPDAVTALLDSWSRGEASARDQLFPIVYAELRRRAASALRSEAAGHTLQPTALVHEAYIRLADQNAGWKNRTQFFAVASRIMRRILVDHARARAAAKRPPKQLQMTLSPEQLGISGPPEVDLIALDDALEELAAADPRQAQVVEFRFFGGLTQEEIATALDVSQATLNRDWRVAKAWLYDRIAAR
jgi:RNA polymerase sigma-70 factor (ECF subfamily)